jgi:2'-5' RNA ligase
MVWRTFFAIPIPDEIKVRLNSIQEQLKTQTLGDILWTKSEQMHLTLHFLGDVRADRVKEIASEIQTLIERIPSFRISLSRIGCFSSHGKPTIVWMGIEEGLRELEEVNRVMGGGLIKLGVKIEEREYHPHVTLGRIRKIHKEEFSAFKRQMKEMPPDELRFSVSEILFIRSELTSRGSKYSELGRIKFSS